MISTKKIISTKFSHLRRVIQRRKNEQINKPHVRITVEPLYNEVLGTMKITLLYQVSRYIRVKNKEIYKSWDQQNDLVIRGFCYIRPLYNEVGKEHCILQIHKKIYRAVKAHIYSGSYNEVLGTMKIKSGFSLYQGKKQRKYIRAGTSKMTLL